MLRSTYKRSSGNVLIEAVVGIALILPISVLSILVALEASHAFVISRGMTEGAGLAQKALAMEYRTNKNVVTDSNVQQSIYSNIRIRDLIHDNSQFEIDRWNLDTDPKTVSVRISYIPGAGTPPLEPFQEVDC